MFAILSLLALILLHLGQSDQDTTEEQKLLNASIVNLPKIFFDNIGNGNLGRYIDVRGSEGKMTDFINYIPYHYKRKHKWSDGEAISVVEKYFWGIRDGVCIELGALDGEFLSQSRPLSYDLGWHRIIIEGAPKYRSEMALKSPDALAVSSAICSHAQSIHFAEGSSASGILEFMTEPYLRTFFPAVLSTPKEMWSTLPFVKKQGCLPLQSILRSVGLTHVNWFLLDVEGAELSILQTIDFKNLSFDVITVETERKFRPVGNFEQIVSLLDINGYRKSWDQGRNTWFVNKNFTVISRPGCIEDRECR